MNKNLQATSSLNEISLTMRKTMFKFYEEKNQHPTSFTNKNQTQQVRRPKISMYSRNKISLTRRKINVEVSH